MRSRPLSDFVNLVPRAQLAVAPECCLCKKLVNRVFSEIAPSGDNVVLQFECHGKTERLVVAGDDIRAILNHEAEVFDVLPKHVFWPGFSRYATTTKPLRRVL